MHIQRPTLSPSGPPRPHYTVPSLFTTHSSSYECPSIDEYSQDLTYPNPIFNYTLNDQTKSTTFNSTFADNTFESSLSPIPRVCGWEYTNTQKIYQWPVQLILRWYWYYFCVLKAVSMNRKHLYSFLLLCTLSFKFQSPASQTKWIYSMTLEMSFSQPMFFIYFYMKKILRKNT